EGAVQSGHVRFPLSKWLCSEERITQLLYKSTATVRIYSKFLRVWFFRQVGHNLVTMTKSLSRLHRFAAARFSPEGEYGLHLTVGVVLLLLAMAGFAHLAGALHAGAPITRLDVVVA